MSKKMSKSKKQKLFTIWVGSTTIPEHVVMCIKSWILTNHDVTVYGYEPYDNLPVGSKFADLEPIFPKTKCITNKELTDSDNAGHSYCGVVNMMRIAIINKTKSIWVDADTFVLTNISKFLIGRKNLIGAEFSNWTKSKTFCNGLLYLDTKTSIFKDLVSIVDSYLSEDWVRPDKMHYSLHTGGAKYFQEVIAQNNPEFVQEAISHQLLQCPISKKHQLSLLQSRKLPLRARPHIWGIHLWNTGFFDKQIIKDPDSLVGIMNEAVRNPDRFYESVAKLFVDSISDEDCDWLNVKIDDLMDNPFEFFGDVYVINVDQDIDRWVECVEEFKRMGMENYQRFPGIYHEYGYFGASLSHKGCVDDAKRRRLKNVLICEDDVHFFEDKAKTWDILDKNLENLKTKDWMGFWIGFTPRLIQEVSPIDCSDRDAPFNLEVDFCGCYCYAVNGKYFDEFYDGMSEDFETFERTMKADVGISFLPVNKKWICKPPLTCVRPKYTRTGVTGKKQTEITPRYSGMHIMDYYKMYFAKYVMETKKEEE